MTAAIFSARANLKTVIVEEKACGGLANWTNKVENFPSYIFINGMELMDRILGQVEKLGVEVDQAAELIEIKLSSALKTVETSECIYNGRAIILATGRKPIGLKLETNCENIHYCSVCDGSLYSGKEILVIGGGNSAFDESLYLLSLGIKRIAIVESLGKCCASEITQMQVLSNPNVTLKTNTRVTGIFQNGPTIKVTIQDNKTLVNSNIYVEGVFIFVGQCPNTLMFKDTIDLDSEGYIIVNHNCETNVSGVYAAGDVTQKEFRYLTTAMSDGTIAALAAKKFICKNFEEKNLSLAM